MNTTSEFSATRTLDGASVPVEGTWVIDPGHAEVAFTGRHMVFTKVRGRFDGVSGTVRVATDPADSALDVTISMDSVSSGNPDRDGHLRSAEMFDVERFPTSTYRSVSVEWHGRNGIVAGDLTIHGVTRRVVLDVEFEGYARDPWGGHRGVFSASTKINREDFGLTWNLVLETGGLLVSKEISIDISVEAVLQTT